MEQRDVLLPDLGEGLTEATVVRWLVEVGDRIVTDQVVAEVETAKATVELPTPHAGVVAALHGEPGDEIAVGSAVLTVALDRIARGGETAPAAAPKPETETETEPQPGAGAGAAPASADDDGTDLLVGYGTGGGRGRRRRGRSPAASAHGPSSSRAAPRLAPPPGSADRPRAKPPVRKLAKDLGVDLASLSGSGPDGRITRDDIRAAAERTVSDAAAQAPEQVESPNRIPVTGVRARIADHLSVAWREVPAASCWVECDASRLLQVRDELSQAHPHVKVTPLVLILRACAIGLRQVPELHASYDAETREIIRHSTVALGVATQTERGLLVPVIGDAGGRAVLDLAAALSDVADRARSGALPPGELVGSTFTVSNFGAFGIDGGTPIVHHPAAGILGVGRIAPRPWAVDDAVVVRPVLHLSLSFDHRVCDGAEASTFLRLVADLIERPMLMLAH